MLREGAGLHPIFLFSGGDFMIIELNKHRPGTPESVLDTVNKLVDSGEVESIFCMFRLKDGEIGCTWSGQD
jgi:hypothetical protein